MSLIICLSSCVSSSRHKDLESKLTQTQQELTMSKLVNSKLQQRLGEKSSSNTELEISVAEMQAALDEAAKRKIETDRRVEQYKALAQRFKALVDSGELKIKMVDGRMILALPSDVLFKSGSADISENGHRTLIKTAQLLIDIKERAFQIEGHTDNVSIKTARYPSNWELASARALAVLKIMNEAGMSVTRLSAASYGDTKPVLSNESEEDRQLNRRIEIAIVPDLSLLPGNDALKRLSDDAQ
ncbi:OmpA family protein [bacterium]|nr:OmpA family protein [bacterium]